MTKNKRPHSCVAKTLTASVILPCARCGQPAATFTVLAATEGAGLWRDRDRLERTGFMGAVTKFGSRVSFTNFIAAIQRRDYQAAGQFDPDFVAFHCWSCDQDYCESCWQIGPPEFDEDFYDCTRGACPQGHEQIVDD